MDKSQTSELLTRIASLDARIAPGDPVGFALAVDTWHDAIGDLDYGDAYAAAQMHYRDARDRMMPADVREGVDAIVAARLRLVPPEAVLMAGVDPFAIPGREYVRILQARTAAILHPTRGPAPAAITDGAPRP